ncbi:HD domain-containing protein [Neptunitalea chrysea]|nr:hypothetical protein [Neptunitalea chrysea]
MKNALKAQFFHITNTYTASHEIASDLWNEIETAYTGKKRYYHNLQHIHYMWQLASKHQQYIPDYKVLLWAIFYHDLVYNVSYGNNELKSANIAVARMAQLGISKTEQQLCHDLIMATKHHNATSTTAAYMVDFDLAILGTSPEVYATYNQNIRKEYAIYPMCMYKKRRIKVLEHFLAMERIFKTDTFYTLLESKAHENLFEELKGLR